MKTIIINGSDVNSNTIKEVSKALKDKEKEVVNKQLTRKQKIIDLILEIQEKDKEIFKDKMTEKELKKHSEKELEYMGSLAIQFMDKEVKKTLTKML